MPTNVTGNNGQVLQYNPDANWKTWSMSEIYTGEATSGRFVPKINDYVIDLSTDTKYIVTSIDQLTLIPTMKLVAGNGDAQANLLYGNGGNTMRAYIDTSVTPYSLAVDPRVRIPGSMATYAKIFLGSDVSATGKVLSFLYDGAGNFLTNNLALELAATDGQNNTIKSVKPGFTNQQLSDGQLLTLVAYDDQGHVVYTTGLLAKNTSYIRAIGAPTKYISHISVKSPFLSPANDQVFNYPLNVPLQAMNMIGVVHYSDGSTIEYPLDGSKFSMLGLERFVASAPGDNVKLVLSYLLAADEQTYTNISTDGKRITKPYSLVTIAQDGAYSIKLFPIPVWTDSVGGYQLRWFLTDLNRDLVMDVTAFVRFNTNSDTYNPLSFGGLQNLSVRLNLKDASAAFNSYIHTQTVGVLLKAAGTDFTQTNWLVAYEPNQNPLYGDGLYATTHMVNQNYYQLNIKSGIATQTEWLQRVYKNAKPLIDSRKEIAPLDPTHFAIFTASSRSEYTIDSWDKDLVFTNQLPNVGSVFIEFYRQLADGTKLRLSVSGMPIRTI